MFFKMTSRNAYRDLVRNARRICVAEMSDEEKSVAFQELYTLLQTKLDETERSLNSQPAYAQRCEHWNQRDVHSIKRVSCALAWFYSNPWKDDWIK
jgi:hypothetical protein